MSGNVKLALYPCGILIMLLFKVTSDLLTEEQWERKLAISTGLAHSKVMDQWL